MAMRYAADNMNPHVAPAHLLKAILNDDAGLTGFIETTLDKDYYYLLDWSEAQMESLDKAAKIVDIDVSDEAQAALDEAAELAERYGLDEATSLLAALAMPGVGFTHDQLKTLPLTADEVIGAATAGANPENKFTPPPIGSRPIKG